jgi:hypothetical protein
MRLKKWGAILRNEELIDARIGDMTPRAFPTQPRWDQMIGALIPKEQEPAETYRGIPCKYGHDGLRRASDNRCIECKRRRSPRKTNDAS